MRKRRRKYIGPIDEKAIAARLKEIRSRRGLTQAQVAKALGLGQSIVSHYERGELRLHGTLLVGFAKALRCSSDEILGIKADLPLPAAPQGTALLRRFQRLQVLPTPERRTVLKILDSLLEKYGSNGTQPD